jgi:hypothetical protein
MPISHKQTRGYGLVLGFEAGESFGGVVKGVINAFATEEQTITRFHIHASPILSEMQFQQLPDSGRIVPAEWQNSQK